MKKMILFFVLVFAGVLYSQQNWVWQNPTPQGNSLNDIQSLSFNLGYAGGNDGSIIKTNSAGAEWQLINSPGNINILSINFFDDNTGWVAGAKDGVGYIFETTDSGNLWDQKLTGKASWVTVFFLNKNLGWAAIDSTLYFSNDGGINWTAKVFSQIIYSIQFVNQNTGWLVAGKTIYRTTDGGRNWNSTTIGDYLTWKLNKIVFVDSSTGYVIGTARGPNEFSGYLYKSTDGGVTWNEQFSVGVPLADYRTFTDIKFLNKNLGWTVAGGEIYKTHDGKSWTQISNTPYLTTFTVIDSLVLWGAGRYGALYISTDGGNNWNKTNGGFITETNDIHVLDDKNIFVAGGQSLLKTSDGGKDWQKINIGDFGKSYFDVHSIWFIDSLNGWIGVENLGGWGGLYRTTNGGSTWLAQVDSVHRIFDIYFINDKTGWFFAGDNSYRTDNSGKTWNRQSGTMPNAEIENINFVSSEVGFAGGYLGLFKTIDGGYNWTKMNLNIADPYIKEIYFINSQTGWAAGYTGNSGLVFRTTDGGSNWNIVTLPQIFETVWAQSIFFNDLNNGWLVGNGNSGFVFHSSDSGVSWEKITLPSSSALNRIVFSNNSSGWILGANGEILHTSNGGLTFVRNNNKTLPGKFILEQNYPNPFNPGTVIRYELPKTSNVQIKIYDALGQEVRLLIDETQNAGAHNLLWDGANNFGQRVSSGIYFYRITTVDPSQSSGRSFVETKKMILLK